MSIFSLSKFRFNLTLLQVFQIHSKDTSAKKLVPFTEAYVQELGLTFAKMSKPRVISCIITLKAML
jgi:hypothetical protein